MMEDTWIPLFHDKYAGDHSFTNPVYAKIQPENLEDDDDYHHLFGEVAIDCYNTAFHGFNQLPLMGGQGLNPEMYRVNVHHRITGSTINEMYTLVEVCAPKLYQAFQETGKVPNQDFLMKLAATHYRYQNQVYYGTKTHYIEENIQKVIHKTMSPNDYYDDSEIQAPKEITADLFRYQKCSVHWMIQKEKQPDEIRYSLNDELQIGGLYIDLVQKKINTLDRKKSLVFRGGGIIDEVGLGKTLQMTALAVLNPRSDLSYFNSKFPNLLCSRASLVVCPTQLCGQWERELKAMISTKVDPKIIKILSKTHFEKFTYRDLLDADFVIVSFTFLDNKIYTEKWNPSKNYHRSPEFNVQMVRQHFQKKGKELLARPMSSLRQTSPLFPLIHWQRLIIDEFHEVCSNSKYMYLKNQLPLFTSHHRWCVTATPYSHATNLFHIMEYLTNYQNEDQKMVLLNEKILEKLASDTFRRNTKASVKEEHTLPPIKQEVVWLKFSATERAIYNAYLADGNNDKFSVYLRQLCCHPKLAEETKHALSNCKTLDDMEETLVKHYQEQADLAQAKLTKIEDRIKVVKRKLRKAKRRQQKKKLAMLKGEKYVSSSESEEDSSLEASDSEDEKPIFENAEDEALMALILADESEENKLVSIQNMEDSLVLLEQRRLQAQKEYDGKKTTCNFFTNVLNRIKHTAEKKQTEELDPMNLDDGDMLSMIENQLNALEGEGDNEEDQDDEICAICMGEIPNDDIGVTNCGHIYCYSCLKTTVSGMAKCPQCLKALKKDEIFMLNYEKPEEEKEQTEDEISKEKLVNLVGTKLANLIIYLKRHDEHTIIFSQWDDLLRKVGKVLSEYGIKNIFCKGNVFQRDKAIREFNTNDQVKVIMLSSDRAASGTNLTKATQVILLDPVYGSYKYRKAIETQAIGRAHRLGQKKVIRVVRLIIRDSVEETIYLANQKEEAEATAEMKAEALGTENLTQKVEKSEISQEDLQMLKDLEKSLEAKEQEKLGGSDEKILEEELDGVPSLMDQLV